MKTLIIGLICAIIVGAMYIHLLRKDNEELQESIKILSIQMRTLSMTQKEKEERYAREEQELAKTLDKVEEVSSDWADVVLPSSVINVLSNTTYGSRSSTVSGS